MCLYVRECVNVCVFVCKCAWCASMHEQWHLCITDTISDTISDRPRYTIIPSSQTPSVIDLRSDSISDSISDRPTQ